MHWQHHISTQQLGQELGISRPSTTAPRVVSYAGLATSAAWMDFDRRLPRRMLSSWVPRSRPLGAPTMTYGRSLGNALPLAHYYLDPARWHELAANRRAAWRAMLRAGVADLPSTSPPPPLHLPSPPPPPPPPLARTKPSRACAVETMAKIDAIDAMHASDARLQQILNQSLKPINR